ncbi:MAG: sensor histidine kinase [Oscillospiraceae bacterium]|nr:sensor histidine kinase [Oscillospiraceae bacterium]
MGRKKLIPISVRYRRGILVVSCSMMLLFLLVTLFFTGRAQEAQFLDREYAALISTMESLHVLFSSTEDSARAIVSDDIVQHILRQPGVNRHSDLRTMRKQVGRYMNSNRYLDAVVLYGSVGRVFESGSIVLSEDILEGHESPGERAWKSVHAAPYLRIGDSMHPLVISMLAPIYNYDNFQGIGSIQIMILESNLTETFLDNSGERTFYIVDNNNIILAHPDKSLLMTTDIIPILNNGEPYRIGKSYVLGNKDPHTLWQLKSITPVEIVLDPIYRIILTLFAAGIVIVMICIAFSRKTADMVTKGISQLTASMGDIQGLQERLPQSSACYETDLLCSEFNNMLNKLEASSEQLVLEQISKRRFQVELLQQQIAPHFLYNTLENICSLAELGHRDELIEIVNNMARFYRGVLSKGNVQITLKNELDIADSYLRILKIRYRTRFDYQFDVAPELLSNNCIKLILQPILENSVYHGLSAVECRGLIRLEAAAEDGILLLKVSDNGIGIAPERMDNILSMPEESSNPHKSYGLANVHKRLQLYYGKDCGLDISSDYGKGTTVILRLPLEREC